MPVVPLGLECTSLVDEHLQHVRDRFGLRDTRILGLTAHPFQFVTRQSALEILRLRCIWLPALTEARKEVTDNLGRGPAG